MKKVLNIVFSILAVVVLLNVVANKAAHKIVPGYDPPQWTYLEGRNYQKLPSRSVASVLGGKFQSQFEQYVADLVPARDRVLGVNARLQRGCIEVANVPFGYDAYPTFFGSKFCYSPTYQSISESPFNKASFGKKTMGKAVDAYSDLIESHPDVSWVFFMPERAGTFCEMPASRLCSDMADYAYFKKVFLDELPSSCSIVDGSYSNLDDFFENYFKTDHHWQVPGAMRAYRSISEALGNECIEFGDVVEVFDGPYWGAAARNGNIVAGSGDVCYDVEFEQTPLAVTADGVEVRETWLCESYENPWPPYVKKDLYSNFYGDWFHRDRGLITIENEKAPDRTLLIIGDSFTNSFERFFSSSYRRVFVIDPREYDDTVDAFLSTHGVDDAVFVLSAAHAFSKDVLNGL